MTRCPDPRKRGSGLFFCNKGNEGRGEASAPTEVYLAVRRGGALPLPRATARVAPTEGVQEVRGERNTSVTALPCQPPLGKGAEGTGVRIATASVRTGFAMTWFFVGCGARPGGSSGRPTPTEAQQGVRGSGTMWASSPTKMLQVVWCKSGRRGYKRCGKTGRRGNQFASSATGGASPISPPAGDREGRPYGRQQGVRCGRRISQSRLRRASPL